MSNDTIVQLILGLWLAILWSYSFDLRADVNRLKITISTLKAKLGVTDELE
jgi:hypothetical protein